MSLEDDIMLDVEAWRPDPGDALTGQIIGVAENDTGYGPYPLLEIRSKSDGAVWQWHAFDTVAKNELAKHAVARGDMIAVRFLGEKKKGDGGTYKGWRVLVEKAVGEVAVPNWNQIAEEAKQEGAADFMNEPFPDDDELDALGDEPF